MNVMQQLLMMNVESLLKDFAAYRTFHKSDSVINMRIPHEVLDKIKEIAEGQGVPYQSLISSVLYALTNSDDLKNTSVQQQM
ncbi:MAG: BrnA antitoxin family protein [Rickettsiales bacterium]|nr:BrnA antitoxin family protein [Rickettsiales bacterium]